MSNKIPVGILGATGAVGQNYIYLLQNHPWFEVTYVAASPRSAGKTYREVVASKWLLGANIPEAVANLVIEDANIVEKAKGRCRFVFSALELDSKDEIKALENAYAAMGFPVVSNASAHRWTDNVPMLIPEINADHISVIDSQKKAHGWDTGFVAVKPNCSIQSYMIPVWALMQAGYEVKRMFVSTMQAVSGAGYPGVPSLDMIDNIVPFIGGEEEKTEKEPSKIFGKVEGGKIVPFTGLKVSAHCNRVPVINGHTACISLEFGDKKPSLEEIDRIWKSFRGLPQELDLPFAPVNPIIVRPEANRPQPRRDRDEDKGMAVSIGRLRTCELFDIRFVALSHNTVRGAAGGGILNAELLKAKGYIQ
ncbi:MAG: aspartate-semialdehyde dehydrogenase [Spirochaetales bacterium]|nr:aspartate-semialdehyde dehydrogenase [Spirochaetales bacterium]